MSNQTIESKSRPKFSKEASKTIFSPSISKTKGSFRQAAGGVAVANKDEIIE
jgi:hypothetical protein